MKQKTKEHRESTRRKKKSKTRRESTREQKQSKKSEFARTFENFEEA